MEKIKVETEWGTVVAAWTGVDTAYWRTMEPEGWGDQTLEERREWALNINGIPYRATAWLKRMVSADGTMRAEQISACRVDRGFNGEPTDAARSVMYWKVTEKVMEHLDAVPWERYEAQADQADQAVAMFERDIKRLEEKMEAARGRAVDLRREAQRERAAAATERMR